MFKVILSSIRTFPLMTTLYVSRKWAGLKAKGSRIRVTGASSWCMQSTFVQQVFKVSLGLFGTLLTFLISTTLYLENGSLQSEMGKLWVSGS